MAAADGGVGRDGDLVAAAGRGAMVGVGGRVGFRGLGVGGSRWGRVHLRTGSRFGESLVGGEFDGEGIGRGRHVVIVWRRVEDGLLPAVAAAADAFAHVQAAFPADLGLVDLGELGGGALVGALDVGFAQIHARVGADVAEAVPFVHAEFADADFDVETVVVLDVDAAFAEVFFDHVLVCFFTAFDLGHESSPRFRKVAGCAAHERFPPLVRLRVGATWSLACADADENADVAAGIFVQCCFIQRLWRWVEPALAFIDEDRLSYLYGFER